MVLLVRVGIPSLRESGGSTLRGSGDRVFLVVCVASLWLRGLRWKKSISSVDWEVPVRSQRLGSGMREQGEAPVDEEHRQAQIHLLWYFSSI